MNKAEVMLLIVVGAAALYLLTRWWFWWIGLGLAALASGFACLASIVHFQILGAMGFFFLTSICTWLCFFALAFGEDSAARKREEEKATNEQSKSITK